MSGLPVDMPLCDSANQRYYKHIYKKFARHRCLTALVLSLVLFCVYSWHGSTPVGRFHRLPAPLCVGRGWNQCLPSLRRFDSKFRVAAKYQLAACVIEKDMSTILAAIMCYLTDPEAFSKANRSLTRDIYETRFCKEKNEYKSLSALTEKTGTKVYDWRLYTVVRDPVDRFLSGFVDKCVLEQKKRPNKCYGCGQNMSCFLHELFERGRQFGAGKPIGYSYDDIHFYPQNWHCEFSSHMQRYAIIHYASEQDEYEAMLNDLALIFAEQGVPASLMRHILEELTSSRTRHATVASPQRRYHEAQLRSDSKLMNLLVRIFYYDYVLFGFPLPF